VLRGLIPLLVAVPSAVLGQASDVASQLAAARQALGRDAALNRVASLTVNGSLAESIGPLTTTVGGRKSEDVKLGKFKINEKIDPGKFAAPR
jgi:hypothetical protein